MSHDQFQFRPSGSDYDTSQLRKLDARRPLDNRSPPRRPGLSSSSSDAVPRYGATENRQLPYLSLPIRSTSITRLDSPSDAPLLSAGLPRAPFPGFGSSEYRSPVEPTDADRSPPFRCKRTYSGSVPDDVTVSTQGSYENPDDTDFPMEDAGMGRLHIDESNRSDYHTVGQKRRASSPLDEEMIMQNLPGAGDLLRRREGLSRASQPRLTIPQSFSPISTSRSGSYAPSLPLTAASATSVASSFGRRSPGGLSPCGGLSPVEAICNSPYNTPISLTHSPRSSFSRATHQRQISESRPLASPRKLTDTPKANMPRIQGFYMCECCPKKPKKFETAEELR